MLHSRLEVRWLLLLLLMLLLMLLLHDLRLGRHLLERVLLIGCCGSVLLRWPRGLH